jgi:rubrerythrin
MEQTDLEQYIVIYYHNLLTFEEKAAYKHHLTTLKAKNSDNTKYKEMLMRKWGTTDQDALSLLEGGYDGFKKKVAARILNEELENVFINNCPKCGKLARTPEAKQCRFCGHDWH